LPVVCQSLLRRIGQWVEKEDLMESVEQVLEGYAAAVRGKDVGGFVSLYAKDVRVFDMWGRWSYDGTDAWRGMATEWFGSLGDEQVGVEFQDVQKVVGDGLAVISAFVTYKDSRRTESSCGR
jgi:ketosteroid isomerase-like protein